MKKLIILYGRMSDNFHVKQQLMIDGHCTCGYRQYAQRYGEIIYLAKQTCREGWERDFGSFDFSPAKVVEYLNAQPDAIVWALKHDPVRDKEILSKIKNKKAYYSCCAYDTINKYCDVSLVDTQCRVKENAKVWVKGKDPAFWFPVKSLKLCDYLLIGRRADKNELYFIDRLTKEVGAPRTVLWIGGAEHAGKIGTTQHKIITTEFKSMVQVRDLICTARVGVLISEHPAEGFPQSFLEMTMCGVPVVYGDTAPYNPAYFSLFNSVIVKKEQAIEWAEICLKNYDYKVTAEQCRQYAIENYSLVKSYESILRAIGE